LGAAEDECVVDRGFRADQTVPGLRVLLSQVSKNTRSRMTGGERLRLEDLISVDSSEDRVVCHADSGIVENGTEVMAIVIVIVIAETGTGIVIVETGIEGIENEIAMINERKDEKRALLMNRDNMDMIVLVVDELETDISIAAFSADVVRVGRAATLKAVSVVRMPMQVVMTTPQLLQKIAEIVRHVLVVKGCRCQVLVGEVKPKAIVLVVGDMVSEEDLRVRVLLLVKKVLPKRM